MNGPFNRVYEPLNRPLLTIVDHRMAVQYGVLSRGYLEVWRPYDMCSEWYARWWIAWLIRGAISFALHMDETAITMRLDAPEFIRQHEGEPMPCRWFGPLRKFLQSHMEPLMYRRAI